MISVAAQDLEDFNCPICLLILEAPIYQCAAGHTICGNCKNSICKCPFCNGTFADTRNYSLEALMEKMSIKCTNQFCNVTVPLKQMNIHLSNACSFRKRSCGFSNCDWNNTADLLADHMHSKHAAHIVKNNVLLQSHQLTCAILQHENEFFIVKRYIDEETKTLIWTGQARSAANPKTKYMLSVKILTPKGELYVVQQPCSSNINISESELQANSIISIRKSKTKNCKFMIAVEKYAIPVGFKQTYA